ncbi:MAG: type VI secretion system baseplate subunit TssF, partial [bacterium]|nr:type VI secretion system baseplate subunit TssF [Candidatus Kapabacteria bacterium]
TPLYTNALQGHPVNFRTCYPVTVWPVSVKEARFDNPELYTTTSRKPVAAAITVRIERSRGAMRELKIDRLRFYLNGDLMQANALYELIAGQLIGVALVPDGDGKPIVLPPSAVTSVGFNVDDEVIPCPRYSRPEFRLLQEYFVFPEKYRFIDVSGLEKIDADRHFDIVFLLDTDPTGRVVVDANSFALGCTPIVNLFVKSTEPIRLSHLQSEYPLVADGRRERTTEIHTVLGVSASSDASDAATVLEPYFSFSHATHRPAEAGYWYARRTATERKDFPGTDMSVSIVDLDFTPSTPAFQTIFAHTLCTNRDLASQLPAGSPLSIELAAPVTEITCLTKPTRQLDPPLEGRTLWRLISHLSLNQLSLGSTPENLDALHEILQLYTYGDEPSRKQQVDGIEAMETRTVVKRIGNEAWRGFCRGTEVTLTFNESMFVGSSTFLFASVLSRFFALYSSINSFVQLRARSTQRDGVWKTWPPMVGGRDIL